MDNYDPTSILQEIAEGSLGKVIVKNNKLILVGVNTEKIKNKVLREFVEQAVEDGKSYEAIAEMLLIIDEAVEQDTVKQTLNDYI